jgi:hypothetical protein
MLAVVQQEQRLLPGKMLAQRLDDRLSGSLRQSERPRNRRGQPLRIGYGCEIDEPRAIGEHRQQARSDLDGKPRLSTAPDASQRDEPVGDNDLFELFKIGFLADEAGHCARQVVAARLWRKVRGQSRLLGEPVAVSRHRLDDSLAEDLAQRGDLHLEVVFLDHHPGPCEVEQFVLGNQSLAPFDQRKKDVECPRTQRCRLAVHKKLPTGRVQFEPSEAVRSVHGRVAP